MPNNFRSIKGKVVIEDQFTLLEEEIVKTRYKNKKAFEFWRMNLKSLDFLKDLHAVEDLGLINVKIENAAALGDINTLKKLFLNQVRPASGWDFLAQLSQIGQLHLLNIRGSLTLPGFENLTSLKAFHVWGCKGFADISILKDTRNLEEVKFVGTALEPDDLLPLFERDSIKFVSAQFKTKQQNDIFLEYLEKYKKKQYPEV